MVRYMRSRRTSFPDELTPDKFSIQSDEKQKNNISNSNTNNDTTTNKNNNNNKKCSTTNIPIQELENLFHIKKEGKDTRFMNHLQQNIQFAKENNLLKIKINELESRLNNLLKENLKLKQQNSINEAQYKKTLNEQINILEYGIFKRFDEIILMFDNIRKRERLSTNLNPLWNKYHADNNNTNSNNNNNISNPSNTPLTPSKKRNRRKSMFIQSDDLPSVNKDNQNNHISQSSESFVENCSIPILKHPDNSIGEDAFNNNTSTSTSTSSSSSSRSSPSILDYSIPEEPEDNLNNNNKQSDININTHIKEVNIPTSIVRSSDNSKESITATATATTSLESITKKNQRKRTQKHPPKTQKSTKKSVSNDDIMPNTASNIKINTDIDIIKQSEDQPLPEKLALENRILRRSTRGKVVNYKLPSLRAKMRRPTEKLVDATIVNDIHEYEVNLNRNTIIKEESPALSLKHINDKMVPKSNQHNTKDKPKGKEINSFEDKDTKLEQNIPPNDQSVIDNSVNHRLIVQNPKDTVLRKKTQIYNDLPQDFTDSSFEVSEPVTQDVKSDKVTQNKSSRKRGINTILDDMEDKENDTSKRINVNTGDCLKMKHTFDLNFGRKLISPSSSSSSSISVSLSKPLKSSKLSSSNSNNNSNSSSNQILSDITNKNKPSKQLTKKNKRKLLKTAIINDLYNDAEDLDIYDKWNKTKSSPSLSSASSSASFRSLSSSFHYQDTSNNSKENRTVSFRFGDDDLSVFDLLDKSTTNIKKVKAKHTNK